MFCINLHLERICAATMSIFRSPSQSHYPHFGRFGSRTTTSNRHSLAGIKFANTRERVKSSHDFWKRNAKQPSQNEMLNISNGSLILNELFRKLKKPRTTKFSVDETWSAELMARLIPGTSAGFSVNCGTTLITLRPLGVCSVPLVF